MTLGGVVWSGDADTAMYEHAGYRVFDPARHASGNDEFHLSKELRSPGVRAGW